MAPECFTRREYSEATDAFAYGKVVCSMLLLLGLTYICCRCATMGKFKLIRFPLNSLFFAFSD